ncbi:hypothetical protein [Pendulispora albinea]|uniref:Uncharacterized protein n=1 Tax=Pendulispora albinea TaxID=2741071 RepID=A0ABZ2M0M5_9BACT
MMNTLFHEKAFAEAWADPRNTRYELPALDVNRVLSERYRLGKPLLFTRTMLWTMETRKARRPDLYIPYVVAEGSADAWDDHQAPDGADIFVRKSQQRLWTMPEKYTLVIEQTRLNHVEQKVTFIGAAEYPDRDGQTLRVTAEQPIFHVVHGVIGEEDRPLNTWFIVHLTDAPDDALLAPFRKQAADPYLPGYIEIFIRNDLGIELVRR